MKPSEQGHIHLMCSSTTCEFLHMTLVVDKMNGHGLSNKAHCEYLLKKTKLPPHQPQTHKPTLITRWSTSVIKVRGYMHSNAFKTRLGFSFTVIRSFRSIVSVFFIQVKLFKFILQSKQTVSYTHNNNYGKE